MNARTLRFIVPFVISAGLLYLVVRSVASEPGQVIAALAEGGLAPIEVTEFDPWVEGRTVKLVFVCRQA